MIDRRTFFTAASGLAFDPRMARASAQGANNRIRIGIIGTGGRARGLMNLLKRLPGNEMVAVCDVYEPRMLQAAEIAGAAATKVADYRRILDDREIDAVSSARPITGTRRSRSTPSRPARTSTSRSPSRTRSTKAPRWSRPSRPRSRSCRPARSSAAGSTGCSASRSSTRASWDRSHSSRPTGISTRRAGNYAPVAMDKLDWKAWLGPAPDQPFRPERFYQWRHFWDFGGGCMTDLMTHWIDVVHWYMDVEAPLSAVATGRNYNLKIVGSARHGQRDAGVPEELHGRLPGHVRQPSRRRRARVPGDRARSRSTARGSPSTATTPRMRRGRYTPEPDIFVRSSGDGTLDASAELARLHPQPQDAERARPRRPPGGANVPHCQRGDEEREVGALEQRGGEDRELTTRPQRIDQGAPAPIECMDS